MGTISDFLRVECSKTGIETIPDMREEQRERGKDVLVGRNVRAQCLPCSLCAVRYRRVGRRDRQKG